MVVETNVFGIHSYINFSWCPKTVFKDNDVGICAEYEKYALK
jgi:hypothetical protein